LNERNQLGCVSDHLRGLQAASSFSSRSSHFADEKEKKYQRRQTQSHEQDFQKEAKRVFLFQKFPKHSPEKNRIKILRLDFQSARRTFHKIRLLCELKFPIRALIRPPPVFFLIHAYFLSFENYPAVNFRSRNLNRRAEKPSVHAPLWARETRSRQNAAGKILRVNYSTELMSPGEEKFENEKIFSRRNGSWRIFAPVGEFLHRNLICRERLEMPLLTQFTSQIFRARFSLANFCKKLQLFGCLFCYKMSTLQRNVVTLRNKCGHRRKKF
jgi:hypothetical protein